MIYFSMKRVGVLFSIYILFCTLTGCSSLDHQDKSFVFYKDGDFELTCTEPLAVFVDFDNTINIYDNVHKTHYSTKSRTRFISTLSKICSETYYESIQVLTLCMAYDKQTVLYDILQDTTLVRPLSYIENGDTLTTTVKSLETPCTVLKFNFSPEHMYCTCLGG